MNVCLCLPDSPRVWLGQLLPCQSSLFHSLYKTWRSFVYQLWNEKTPNTQNTTYSFRCRTYTLRPTRLATYQRLVGIFRVGNSTSCTNLLIELHFSYTDMKLYYHISVSYTHLDVYKRQAYTGDIGPKIVEHSPWESSTKEIKTDLDDFGKCTVRLIFHDCQSIERKSPTFKVI